MNKCFLQLMDETDNLKFHVIEQTEFIDDQSYRSHRSSSNQTYFKRCYQTKVSKINLSC